MNPLWEKEIRSLFRSSAVQLSLMVYLGVLAAVILFLWPTADSYASSPQEAQRFFIALFIGQMGLTLLLFPALAATSITGEKERGTLDFLYTALFSKYQILTGKMLGVGSLLVVLLLLALPLQAFSFWLGGIGVSEFLQFYSILTLSALAYGMLGMAVSSFSQRSSSAVLWTLVMIGIFCAFATGGETLLALLEVSPGQVAFLKGMSPFHVLWFNLFPDLIERPPLWNGLNEATLFFGVFHTLLGILALGLFTFRAAKPDNQSGEDRRSLVGDEKDTRRKNLGFPFYLIDPLRRKKMISNFANPIFVTEWRQRMLYRPERVMRAWFACVCLVLLSLIAVVWHHTGEGVSDLKGIAAGIQVSVLALVLPVMGCAFVSGEREHRTLDLLKLTPLRPTSILVGKLFASFIFLLIFLLTVFPAIIAFNVLESHSNLLSLIGLFSVLGTLSIHFLASGCLLSTFCQRTLNAVSYNYAYMGLLLGGTAFLGLLAERIPPNLQEWALTINPIFLGANATGGTLPSLTLPTENWIPVVIGYNVISVVMMSIAALRFHSLYRPQ